MQALPIREQGRDVVRQRGANVTDQGRTSLVYMNFIKLVNGAEGESHKTPPVHLKMLDKLAYSTSTQIANLSGWDFSTEPRVRAISSSELIVGFGSLATGSSSIVEGTYSVCRVARAN